MATITLRGVPISFPFEPYSIQKDYMEKVLDCVQNETNGVLESPTGTGKTLSLLCSTLAWLQMKKTQVDDQRARTSSGLPRIIYASRTHTQLSQAMQEMKRTAYSHMKAVVLGSRDHQLCIHPEVEMEDNGGFKRMMCQIKVKTRSCSFYNKVDKFKTSPNVLNKNIMDIEDIVTLGKDCGFCPFYMSKELNDQADIIFMPYNYVLDPSIRKDLDIDLANTIVILDEAHNVGRICEESTSLQIKSSHIALGVEDVTAIMKMVSEEPLPFEDSPKDFNAEELCYLKKVLLKLEKNIDKIDLNGKCGKFSQDGNFIFELLGNAGIHAGNFFIIVKLISNIIQFLAAVNDGHFARRCNNLQIIEDILTSIFSNITPDLVEVKKCYKVYIEEDDVSAKAGGKIINYWCFSPGFGMKLLLREGLKTLILTSGTLAPLEPLILELTLNVGVRLENPHIIGSDQICVKIVPSGPDCEPLDGSFKNRYNPEYLNSLGMSLLNITRVVPDGLLIFFPSYPIMIKCHNAWQQSEIWDNINNIKPIYVEPRNENSLNTAMADYYSKLKDSCYKGAIFMGICGGKLSESLDFVDGNCRSVIITGLPFPPFRDPKIIVKRQYLDEVASYGDLWYGLEAHRAVNQVVGRVIRHRDDYGAILLLDNRFTGPSLMNQMSLWLRNNIKVSSNFGELMRDLKLFFKVADARFKAVVGIKKEVVGIKKEVVGTTSVIPPTISSFDNKQQASSSSENLDSTGEVVIYKRNTRELQSNQAKKMKLTVVINSTKQSIAALQNSSAAYITTLTENLDRLTFTAFRKALEDYRSFNNISSLTTNLDNIFRNKSNLKYLIRGLENYISIDHKFEFSKYCQNMGSHEV